ncbi:MAG TPA: potassium-transporting ATPase subunit KdpC [Candidatus Margulisiibacteriota bacterium]|nr:potassium-transporting ATPase subunit KdpC [Candidatus Margulisiibacteriota bacterium]
MFREQVRTAIMLFIILSVITGIIYPLSVMGFSQLFLYENANGSLISQKGKPVGSALIGQSFDDPKYFWGRLSATTPAPFNAASSSGSNLGPLNPALLEAVKARIKALKEAGPGNNSAIPADLVTSSASGLDPHISIAAAFYQMNRVARIRGLSQGVVKKIILQNTSSRFLGVIGEPVVNVLKVNLALDAQNSK